MHGCVARSSAEAEIYTIVQAGCEGLGARLLPQGFGLDTVHMEIRPDASAACRGIARKGAGDVKYVEFRSMWARGPAAAGNFALMNIPWEENIAKVLTHSAASAAFIRAGARVGGAAQVMERAWPRGGGHEHMYSLTHALLTSSLQRHAASVAHSATGICSIDCTPTQHYGALAVTQVIETNVG